MCRATCRRSSARRARLPRAARRRRRRHRDAGDPDPRAEEKDDPNVVKAVGAPIGPDRLRALYFTRARAPWGEGELLHHIGLYAYRREALERFVAAAALAARKARAARAVARAGGGHADRHRARRRRAARRRHGRGSGARAAMLAPGRDAMTGRIIAYQGEPGANSHIACAENFPDRDAAALRHLRGRLRRRCRTARPNSA